MRVLNPKWAWWPQWADVFNNAGLIGKVDAPVLIMHVSSSCRCSPHLAIRIAALLKAALPQDEQTNRTRQNVSAFWNKFGSCNRSHLKVCSRRTAAHGMYVRRPDYMPDLQQRHCWNVLKQCTALARLVASGSPAACCPFTKFYSKVLAEAGNA